MSTLLIDSYRCSGCATCCEMCPDVFILNPLTSKAELLLPDQEVTMFVYEGNPVSVELPTTVTLEVVETQPQMKGATATASYKPAKTNTGKMVQVPQFIDVGQKIKVDTRTGEYLERA